MWWQDTTDSRLGLINARAEELRAEAATNRAAQDDDSSGEVTIAVSGRHFHLGSLVVVFGRTIREEKHYAHGVRA